MSEDVHIHPMPDDTVCAVHDWPTDGMARRLVEAMRAAHGKGGINVCVECITRAKGDAKARLRR